MNPTLLKDVLTNLVNEMKDVLEMRGGMGSDSNYIDKTLNIIAKLEFSICYLTTFDLSSQAAKEMICVSSVLSKSKSIKFKYIWSLLRGVSKEQKSEIKKLYTELVQLMDKIGRAAILIPSFKDVGQNICADIADEIRFLIK